MLRDVMEDLSELFALEPFGGGVEQVQIGRVGVSRLFVLVIIRRS